MQRMVLNLSRKLFFIHHSLVVNSPKYKEYYLVSRIISLFKILLRKKTTYTISISLHLYYILFYYTIEDYLTTFFYLNKLQGK